MTEDKLLKECLNYLNLSELPKELDRKSKKVCLESINKVMKQDGSIGYVITKINPKTLQRYYYKEFGEPCLISKTLAVYPYLYLSEKYMLKADTKDKKVELINAYSEDNIETSELYKMTIEELNNEILKLSIQNFYNKKDINNIINDIKDNSNNNDANIVKDIKDLISETTNNDNAEVNNSENNNTSEDDNF